MENWSLNWNQFTAILGAVALLVSIGTWMGRVITNKYTKQKEYATTIQALQSDLTTIKVSISEIKATLDVDNQAVIELAKEVALQGASIKAAWREIDKIQENCKEIQAEKRKERVS